MSILSNIVLVLAIIVAIFFSLLVLITGKGDAMSGGGSVRTSYKGKATFDDIMSNAALYLGISFMVLVLLYNVVSVRAKNAPSIIPPPAQSSPVTVPPVNNAPAGSNNSASNNAPVASNNSVSNNAPAGANNAPAGNTPASNNSPAANTPPASNNAPAGNAPAANNASK